MASTLALQNGIEKNASRTISATQHAAFDPRGPAPLDAVIVGLRVARRCGSGRARRRRRRPSRRTSTSISQWTSTMMRSTSAGVRRRGDGQAEPLEHYCGHLDRGSAVSRRGRQVERASRKRGSVSRRGAAARDRRASTTKKTREAREDDRRHAHQHADAGVQALAHRRVIAAETDWAGHISRLRSMTVVTPIRVRTESSCSFVPNASPNCVPNR